MLGLRDAVDRYTAMHRLVGTSPVKGIARTVSGSRGRPSRGRSATHKPAATSSICEAYSSAR